MSSDNRFDSTDELDIEIAKSVEKLIDEETSVAKAFVDRDMSPRVHNDSLGKTQVIPNVSDAMQSRNSQHSGSTDNRHQKSRQNSGNSSRNAATSGGRSSERTEPSAKERAGTSAKRSSKNNKKKSNNSAMIMLIAGVLILAIAVLLVVSLILNNKKLDSYDYNYSTGLGYYNSRNYADALTYWEKASTDSEGRRNVDLKIKMYECYAAVGNKNKAVEMLKDALSYDKYNEKALVLLAKYYSDKESLIS